MEQELINYIKNAKAHGLADSVIKQNLLDAGWEAKEVEEAFTHFKATLFQPVTNKDEDIVAGPLVNPAIHSQTPPSLEQRTQPVNVNSVSIVQPNGQSNKKSHFAKVLIIAVIVAVLLSGGAYAAYTQILNNPKKVWEKYGKSVQTQISESKFKVSYSDPNKLEDADGIGSFELRDLKLEFDGKGYLDATDKKNPQAFSEIQFTFGSGNTSFSTGFKYKLINKVLYLNIGENPFLNQFFNNAYKSGLVREDLKSIEWIKIDLNKLEDEANQASEGQNEQFNKIFDQTFQDELNKLWKDAKFIKIDKIIGKEKINEINTFHYKLTIDKTNIKQTFSNTVDKIYNQLLKLENKTIVSEIQKNQKVLDNVKLVINLLVDKFEVKEFETWVGIKDGRLYKAKFQSNAPSVVSFIKVAMEEARVSGYDAKRLADIRQMASALELFFNDYSGYPESLNGIPLNITPTYIGVIPTPPKNTKAPCNDYWNSYWYTAKGKKSVFNGKNVYSDYELTFCLSQNTAGYSAGTSKLSPKGIESMPCPNNCAESLVQDSFQNLSNEDKIKKIIEKIEFSATFAMENEYLNYDKKQTIVAPEISTDLIEIFKGQVKGIIKSLDK